MNVPARMLFSLLGAFGVVSLANGAIELERHIAEWVQIWQRVTYPVMEFLFGWIFDWIGWKFPGWLKDYLTVGTITMFSTFRAFLQPDSEQDPDDEDEKVLIGEVALGLIIMLLFWPLLILFAIHSIYYTGNKLWKPDELVFETRAQALTFLESYIYAILIIICSYALIHSGISAAPAA